MRLDLVALYNKAKKCAVRSGYAREAEEFAPWYVIRIMEGHCKHQLIGHSLIDYLRMEYGCNRTNKWKRVDVEIEIIDSELSPEDKVIITNSIEKLTTPFERELMKMYYAEGKTLKEIGEEFGRSEGYISERIRIIRERISSGKIPQADDKNSIRRRNPRRKAQNYGSCVQEETII